jgi:hypothetical protein
LCSKGPSKKELKEMQKAQEEEMLALFSAVPKKKDDNQQQQDELNPDEGPTFTDITQEIEYQRANVVAKTKITDQVFQCVPGSLTGGWVHNWWSDYAIAFDARSVWHCSRCAPEASWRKHRCLLPQQLVHLHNSQWQCISPRVKLEHVTHKQHRQRDLHLSHLLGSAAMFVSCDAIPM